MKEETDVRGGSVEGRRARLAEALAARGRRAASRSSRLRVGSADALVAGAKRSDRAVDVAADAVESIAPVAPVAPVDVVDVVDVVAPVEPVDVDESAEPTDPAELAARARTLARTIDLSCAELIITLRRFDALGGWAGSGSRSCVEWIQTELGFAQATAYQYLKVGQELLHLPVIAAHFGSGALKLNEVLALLRVASPEDDAALATLALDHGIDELAVLLDQYRWGKQAAQDAAAAREGGESARERARHERRCLRIRKHPDGTATLTANLPAERMACVAELVERIARKGLAEARKIEPPGSRPTLAQCRADALEHLAKAALTGKPGAAFPKVTEPLVIAVVDHEVLEPAIRDVAAHGPDSTEPLPLPVRCAVVGLLGASIGERTARQLACEGSLLTMLVKAGEPLAMGRAVRHYTRAQRTAISVRGGYRCSYPGCTATHGLAPHHVWKWGDGGSTDAKLGTDLCTDHHARVHDDDTAVSVTRLGDAEPRPRDAAAAAVLAGANGRTRAIVAKLDARKSAFRFEEPESGGQGGSVHEPPVVPSGSGGEGEPIDDDDDCTSADGHAPNRCREMAGFYAVERADRSFGDGRPARPCSLPPSDAAGADAGIVVGPACHPIPVAPVAPVAYRRDHDDPSSTVRTYLPSCAPRPRRRPRVRRRDVGLLRCGDRALARLGPRRMVLLRAGCRT